MGHELSEGIQLTQITFNVSNARQYRIGVGGCKSIVVVEQCGQMSLVPWAMVFFEHTPPELVNLSLVQCVALLETPK